MVYFLSDLHLGAKYFENPREKELAVVRFLDSIAADAEEVYLLGDVLDYWYEYRTVVPRGYVRFFAALARLTDAGVKVTWMTGNHDVWLFDYLRTEIGIRVLKGYQEVEIKGTRFLLSHGDDVGQQPWTYRALLSLFHNRLCQRLYASVHPRITYAIAHGWSHKSRTSHSRQQKVKASVAQCYGNLVDFARAYGAEHPAVKHFVMGHLHMAKQETIDEAGRTLTILGDWISKNTYATFDGSEIMLHTFKA
ncbi:MAG: UDP-2,3-diacylglucosamine diphosphatase [Bacteroidales bacterium]|nr:UDP-2,3-diacylglucosamine diphosphatase [Bacteroidales bacterium]